MSFNITKKEAAGAAGQNRFNITKKEAQGTTQTRAALPLPSVSEEEKKPRPLERIGSAASGALKGYGAGFANIGGTAMEGLKKLNDTAFDQNTKQQKTAQENSVKYWQQQIDSAKTAEEKEKAKKYLDRAKKTLEGLDKLKEAETKDVQKAADTVYQKADALQKSSAGDVEKAKQGLGGFGQFAVDLGVAGAQMAGDIALGAATGGGALVPMAARVFGGSAQEARQGGATFGQQLAYGAGSAALSVATEQIANTSKLMQKAFGKSTLANAVTKKFGDAKVVKAIGDAVGKMQQTAAGRAAINAISEGGEEFIEDIFQPVLQRATYNKDAEFDLGQALYDAAVGGALGMIGGVGEKTKAPALPRGSEAQGVVESEANGQSKAERMRIKTVAEETAARENTTAPGETVQYKLSNDPTEQTHYYTHNFQKNKSNDSPVAGANSTNIDSNAYVALNTDSMPENGGNVKGENATQIEAERVARDIPYPEKNENGLGALTQREIENLSSGKKNKIVSTVAETVSFIRNALTDKSSSERAYLGKISDSTAKRVLAQTGVNITGYNAILPSDAVRHMFKHHGDAAAEQKRGQIALTEENAALLTEVLANPDKVTLSERKDERGRTVLLFEKQVGNNYITAQAVSDGTHSIQTDTLYIQKKKNSQDTEYYNAALSSDPAHNARSVPSQSSSVNSITNASGNVKQDAAAKPRLRRDAEINTEANRQSQNVTDMDYEQQRRDLDELWETWEKQAAVTSEAPEKADPADLVSAEVEKESKGFGESVKDLGATLRRKWFDSADALSEIGKATGDKALYPYFNMARASSNAAINMITTAQTNVKGETVGKSLNDIFEPIRAKGNDYYNLFQTYLFHRHNVDRMSRYSQENVNKAAAALRTFKTNNPELLMYEQYQLEQMAQDEWSDYNVEAKEYVRLLRELRKAENTKNKPVFGFGWGAEESRAEADKLLREHPEFEALAEDVYTYTRNLMQYRADSGLITEEQKKNIESIYPHYVPTFRWTEKTPLQMDERSVQIGSTIKQAKGGDGKLIPLHKALADQTMSVVREGSKNRFGQRLLSAERSKSEGAKKHLRHVEEAENGFSADTFDDVKEDFDKVTNTFTVRSDGKRYDITVSPDLYEGIKALTPEQLSDNKFLKGARRANDLFKKLCTSMSPTFMIRNPVKDLQDAGLYSKDAKEFAKQFPRAAKEISTNGEYWQRYKALGGTYTSFFDYETGNSGKRSKLAEKTVGRIETLNDAIEQAPRLAEFMATVEKAGGLENASMDTLMKAMHNAADVTVNFGRSGTIARTMNRYVPFFNAGMQGLSKNVRLFTETKGAKDWTKLVTKCVILGVVPRIANEMMFGDRDDWDEIKDEVKDQNYLFPIGDGKWLKIPKGRALSTFGMLGNAADAKMSGEEIDARYILSTAADNLAPANPLKNNIFAAAMDSDLFDPSSPGTTWYGGDIESQRLQNYAPEERYDAKTDELSKWLGKTLGLSPKKINYILDQYTGFAGDVILPMMTTAAETSPFVNAFVVNSTTNNRLSGDFYDKLDELTFAKNGKSATGADAVTYRWFSKQNSAVGEINAAIREIEADPTLSGSEKKELLEAQYKIRNAAEKSALDMLDQYADAAKFYYDASAEKEEDDRVDDAYLRANREVFGAEYALRVYNKNTYEKAQGLEKEGVDYEDFFDVYFTMRDESENLTGSAASNAKRNVIRNSGLSETNKVLLYQKLTATGNDRDDDIEACLNADIDFDTFLLAQNEYTTINEKGGKAKEKAANFAEWVDSQQLTTEQKNVLKDCFMYYTSIPAGGTRKKSSSTNSSTKAKALTKGSLAVKTSGPKLQTPKLALGLPRG